MFNKSGKSSGTQNQTVKKSRCTIMIVDDSELQRKVLERCLQKQLAAHGYDNVDVICADGYSSAVKLIQENQTIKLVITDLHMPDPNKHIEATRSGFQLIQYVKKNHPETQMVLHTTEDRDDTWQAIEEWNIPTLDKPAKHHDLIELLNQFFQDENVPEHKLVKR